MTLAEFDRSAESDAAGALEASLYSITLVIPTLNEARNLPWVLSKIPRFVDEVIVVDGRSTDDTIEIARTHYPDVVVVHETRPGKGAALRAGFAAATGDVIVIIDADGSMDPDEIQRFVALVHAGFDMVKGSRFVAGGGSSDITAFRRVGNWALLGLVNRLYRTNYTDLCYGYLAFRRECLPALALNSDGFEIETEINVRAALAGMAVGEVPSFESPRRTGESNLRSIRDGLRVLRTLVANRLERAPRVIDLDDTIVDATDGAQVIDLREAAKARGLRPPA